MIIEERRLNVWQALSELFLDTELDAMTYEYIAKTIIESRYSPEEIKNILWQEVFPVLESNLRHPAGVWAGYQREWLKENLTIPDHLVPITSSPTIVEEIHKCWAKVCEYLPSQYA